jgi:hypothetical protein
MAEKFAKVVSRGGQMTPTGRERVTEIRAGKKGTGQVLGAVISWPWSYRSEEMADGILSAKIDGLEGQGYTVIQGED